MIRTDSPLYPKKNSMMLIHAMWLILSTDLILDFFLDRSLDFGVVAIVVLIVAEHQTAGAVDGFAVDFDPQN